MLSLEMVIYDLVRDHGDGRRAKFRIQAGKAVQASKLLAAYAKKHPEDVDVQLRLDGRDVAPRERLESSTGSPVTLELVSVTAGGAGVRDAVEEETAVFSAALGGGGGAGEGRVSEEGSGRRSSSRSASACAVAAVAERCRELVGSCTIASPADVASRPSRAGPHEGASLILQLSSV